MWAFMYNVHFTVDCMDKVASIVVAGEDKRDSLYFLSEMLNSKTLSDIKHTDTQFLSIDDTQGFK